MIKIISLGKCSYYLLYPLIYIIFIPSAKLRYLIQTPIKEEFYLIQATGLMFLAEIMGGCLYFFDNFNSQSTKRQINQLYYSTIPQMSITTPYKKYSWNLIIFVLGLGALDLLSSILTEYIMLFGKVLKKVQFVLMALQCFIFLILSVLILHQPIYRHHYVSIAILCLGTILIMIPLFNEKIEYLYPILFFVCIIISSSLLISDKWLMQFKGINPYFLLLIQGIGGFILFGLMEIFIFTLCPDNIEGKWYCNDLHYFSRLDANGLYFTLIQLIELIAFNIFLVKIIYHFSPLYYQMVYIVASIVGWTIAFILKNTSIDFMAISGFCVLVVAFLIFNEIVILHFWKLDFNTAKMIEERSEESFLLNEGVVDFKMCEMKKKTKLIMQIN